MRILWIAPDVPYPLNTGGNVAIYNRIRELHRRGHRISLLAFGRPHDMERSVIEPLREICEDVAVFPKLPQWRVLGRYLLASQLPLRVITRPVQGLRSRLATILKENPPDILQVENSILADVIPVSTAGSKVVSLVNFHSLVYEEFERIAAHLPPLAPHRWLFSLEARRAKAFETGIFQKDNFEKYLFVSDVELRSVAALFPRLAQKLVHVPISIDLKPYEGMGAVEKCGLHKSTRQKRILFFGGFENPANQDAACWFARAIFPRVKQTFSDLAFVVVGRNAKRYVGDLASSDVEILGDVQDMRPHLACADLCVMPLRSGGGVRVKLLEAIAARRIVVTTSLGLDGVTFRAGKEVLVADKEEEFAALCAEVLADPARFERLRNDAYAVLRDKHSWSAVGDQLENLYEMALKKT